MHCGVPRMCGVHALDRRPLEPLLDAVCCVIDAGSFQLSVRDAGHGMAWPGMTWCVGINVCCAYTSATHIRRNVEHEAGDAEEQVSACKARDRRVLTQCSHDAANVEPQKRYRDRRRPAHKQSTLKDFP